MDRTDALAAKTDERQLETDNENPADESSADADVADAYDGAAIKIKADSVVYLTGNGALTINGNATTAATQGSTTTATCISPTIIT